MKWNKAAAGLLAGMMVMGLSVSAEETGDIVELTEVTAIAETLEDGQAVTCVMIEYPGEVAAGTVSLSSYKVPGRKISKVYVNNSGEKGEAEAQGKYVFVELSVDLTPGAGEGGTLLYANGENMRLPINLTIQQTANVTLASGDIVEAGSFTNTAEQNLLVDEFLELTYTNPEDGSELPYRLYIPEGYEEKGEEEALPLVVFLHGAGESGSNGVNNETQLMGNPSALEFAREDAQEEHPCFVLAPQSPSHSWSQNNGTEEDPEYGPNQDGENVKNVIDELIGEYDIDASRIYGTGLSMGSRGTWALSTAYPDLYAAQINIASADVYSEEGLAEIADKPIWALVSSDDSEERVNGFRDNIADLEAQGAVVERRMDEQGWNGYARGEASEEEAKEQLAAAEESGANVLYTEYIAGTTVPNPHWSWRPSFANDAIRDWLFAQQQETPYTPE